LCHLGIGDGAWHTRARLVAQTVEPVTQEPGPPPGHRLAVGLQPTLQSYSDGRIDRWIELEESTDGGHGNVRGGLAGQPQCVDAQRDAADPGALKAVAAAGPAEAAVDHSVLRLLRGGSGVQLLLADDAAVPWSIGAWASGPRERCRNACPSSRPAARRALRCEILSR
jgi:hypothetical protein